MNRAEEPYTVKEALLFSQRMAQLSKALWKSIEKDWQQWIKPYDLNINEHHILWIAYQLNGASISMLHNKTLILNDRHTMLLDQMAQYPFGD